MFSRFIAFYCILILCSCQDNKISTKPKLNSLTESVYASATIQPKTTYQVFSGVTGVIDAIFIEEGQTVQKGQKLAQIVNLNPQINTENARLNAQLAQENYTGSSTILAGIMDDIQAAKLKLAIDSLNFVRQERLWKKQIGSKLEYDNRKLAYDLSVNALQALEKKYQRTKIELATKVKLAKNQLKSSKVNKNDYIIYAKMSGTVYALFKENGEAISMQEPLAEIGHSSDFIIEMEVDEMDIARIKPTQKVLLNLDAYNGQVFEAIVTKIYPQKELRTQTFKIEGVFETPPNVLYPGLSGEANIIISKAEKILTIPLEYLVEEHKVKVEDGIINIQTGRKNMENIEVIAGLDTNSVIIKPE